MAREVHWFQFHNVMWIQFSCPGDIILTLLCQILVCPSLTIDYGAMPKFLSLMIVKIEALLSFRPEISQNSEKRLEEGVFVI